MEKYLSTISQNWSNGMKKKYGEVETKREPSINQANVQPQIPVFSHVDNFIEAASKGNLKKLLEFTTDMVVDLKNSKEETPLIAAALGGQARAVYFLLAKGANFLMLDATGNGAIHHAALLEHLDVIDKLIIKCNPNMKNKNGQTILHVSVKENKCKTLDHIMKMPGVDFDEQDFNGDTAVHIAIKTRNLKVLCKLLTMPVDLSLYNSEGMNPFNLAVEKDEIELLKVLLQSKSGMDLLSNKTLYGESNLEIAIRERFISIIKYLLHPQMQPQKMISAEIDKLFGSTSLHWAVLQLDLDLVEKLLNINCKLLDVKDKHGKTALDHVCSMHVFEKSVKESIVNIAIKLISEGADMNSIQNKSNLFKLIRDTFRLKFKS